MPDEQRGKSNYHTHALARGLLVLETVAGRRDPATLTEIHETSGLPKSTIVRLLSALVEEDYLVRVDEHVTCKTCRKRFEIPSHRNIVFLEELEGLPKDDYDE